MAKKSSAARGGKASKPDAFPEYQFINVSLSKADKVRLSALDSSEEFPVHRVLDLASEGYKFSIKEDTKGGGYLASLTDGREDSRCFKCILTGRGSTPFNSWVSLAYRHYTMLERDWSTELYDTGVPDFD